MKLHEYQAKRLFHRYGIPVPRGILVRTPAQAAQAFRRLKATSATLKVQIHAGGRGKAGGVRAVTSPAQARRFAQELLGRPLVTAQTGPQGRLVERLLLEERLPVAQEYYGAITMDRARARPAALVSRFGGVEIEEVARKDPEAISREVIDPALGLQPYQARNLVQSLQFSGPAAGQAAAIFVNLWRLFAALDASLAEVNPLVLTADQRLLALDAKLSLDDNALFRHPELARLADPHQSHPLEVQAGQAGISYVGLEGNIGCLVNGAGLAMATNDIIKLHGGEPANFLDVGGGANTEQVTQAFQIILADRRVKAILVNIFGGIMKCDVIAQGILAATQRVAVQVPMVVRLEGTNVEAGRRLLSGSRLPLVNADGLEEAAKKVVALARNGSRVKDLRSRGS